MNWNHLAEDRDMLYAFVKTVMNHCVSNNAKNYLISEKIFVSQYGLYSIEEVANWYSVSDVAGNRKWK
jgi:hypothetical protein